jgi:DNA-binding MarR family transcriptional regulator
MSDLVAVLEQRGYLERRVDPSDGRARLVCLTPAGVQMARRALREITAIEAEWREHLARNGVQGDLVAGISNALADRATRSAGETVDLRSSNRASARRPGEGRPEIAQ